MERKQNFEFKRRAKYGGYKLDMMIEHVKPINGTQCYKQTKVTDEK